MIRSLAGIICLVALLTPIYSDVIPDGTHWVNQDVYITNIDQYPEYAIVAYIGAHYGDSAYVVRDSVPLYKGYKLNYFGLFAFTKTLIDSCGGVDSLNFRSLQNLVDGAEVPSPAGTFIKESVPLERAEYFYEIAEIKNQSLRLELRHRLLHFSDGTPDRLEKY